MATELCTLEQLRDHAAANPDKEYDLGSCSSCLAAELMGRWMWNHLHFNVPTEGAHPILGKDEDARVPLPFAEMCDARQDGHWYTGRKLAAAIDRLIKGDNPVQVAQEILS